MKRALKALLGVGISENHVLKVFNRPQTKSLIFCVSFRNSLKCNSLRIATKSVQLVQTSCVVYPSPIHHNKSKLRLVMCY